MKENIDDNEFNINLHEKKIYSQNGEDGIIEFIFSKLGTTNKFSVEFGVGDGFECNTIHLLENRGWKGLMMDYGADHNIQWKGIMKKAWTNKQLSLLENLQKYVKFLKKILKRVKRSATFHRDIKTEKVTAYNIQH